MTESKFIQLPMHVLMDRELSPGAMRFCAHILRWDWGGGCWLTDAQLARELDVTERSIRNWTHQLERGGHLWVFVDREGMTVRLVVRPGGKYSKPAFGCGRIWKKNSQKERSHHVQEYKADEFNNISLPDLEVCTTQQPSIGVVEQEIQSVTEEKNQSGITLIPFVEILTAAGVEPPTAVRLAQKHSARRIQACAKYVRQSRGEKINQPGMLVSALSKGWKLPKWAFEGIAEEKRPRELPVEPRTQTDGGDRFVVKEQLNLQPKAFEFEPVVNVAMVREPVKPMTVWDVAATRPHLLDERDAWRVQLVGEPASKDSVKEVLKKMRERFEKKFGK